MAVLANIDQVKNAVKVAPVLAFEGVSLAYSVPHQRQISLLDNADWSLGRGAQVALCGPSGCGKTSVLNLLAAIEKPQQGRIAWHDGTADTEITALSDSQQETWRRSALGLVFQQFHLFPHMTALQNVLLPTRFAAWHPTTQQQDRASALLDRVGVRPNADIRVLSRGEQQRVAVARALLGGTFGGGTAPRVVLADEPTASLDAATARIVATMLSELCREQGSTLIIATHDRDIAAMMDAVFDMADGKIIERAPETLVESGHHAKDGSL